MIAWYNREIKKHPIDIKLNTEISDLSKLDADEIIIATGAETITLKHEAENRSLFANGALAAAAFLAGKSAGLYSMGDIV